MSLSRRHRPAAAVPDALDERDLVLCVFGPWDSRAECSAAPTPLWHERVQTAHLRRLWSLHQTAIEQAAAGAGLPEPWITSRLFLVDILEAGGKR